jgi:hypothetical protein
MGCAAGGEAEHGVGLLADELGDDEGAQQATGVGAELDEKLLGGA